MPCQARLAWFDGSQEEPAIASTRVKSASRGEVSTEINLVHSGADGALARKKSPQKGATTRWNDHLQRLEASSLG